MKKYVLLITVALLVAISAGSGLSGCGNNGCDGLKIVDDGLPAGTMGVEYRYNMSADAPNCWWWDDDRNVRWELVAGELPPGISIDNRGQIRGAPTVAGVYNFSVMASELTRRVSKGFSITIREAPATF